MMLACCVKFCPWTSHQPYLAVTHPVPYIGRVESFGQSQTSQVGLCENSNSDQSFGRGVIVVMAGSRGKEAFCRPLRQLKSLPRKSLALPGLFSLSSAHLSWSRHQSLTQCQSLADAELGEDVGVISPLLVLAFLQTTSIQPR